MFRILLAAVVGGAMLSYFGFNELRLANTCESEPAALTAAELVRLTPDQIENAHVRMSDFLATDSHVYQQKENDPRSDWEAVWVPVVPLEGEWATRAAEAYMTAQAEGRDPATIRLGPPAASEMRVVLKSTRVKHATEFERLVGRDVVTGVVVNQVEGLNSDTRRLLQESFPGLDVDNAIILEADRTPPGTGKAAGMMGGGIALAGVGLAGGLLRFRRREG